MKKALSLLLILMIGISLTACGDAPASIDLSALKQQMISKLSISDPLDLAAERLTDLYDIDTADVKTSACFITLDGAFPDEIVMVEATDGDAAKRIAEKLELRLADVTNQAQNYDADSFALLQQCKVQTAGNYVSLFISAQNVEMQEMFTNAAKS